MRTQTRTLPEINNEGKDRFWSKVAFTANPNLCWDWTGGTKGSGYGTFTYMNQTYNATRIAYLIHYGIDPQDKICRHTCDRPMCTNPAHLILGTDLDNSNDKIERGRIRPAIGEKHGMAKLTDAQVLEIRKKYQEGCSGYMLGVEYKVAATTIMRVVRAKKWKHISDVDKSNERGAVINPYAKIPKGSEHGNAKLTEEIVLKIRAQHKLGAKVTDLAWAYGITQPAMGRIIRRERWGHI